MGVLRGSRDVGTSSAAAAVVGHRGVSSVSGTGASSSGRAGQGSRFSSFRGSSCLTCAGADLAARRKACQRRNLVSSAISAAALISTTLKTARPRRRCWRSRPTRPTTAAGEKNAPTAIPARCSGTGRPTATTTRPSNARRGREGGLRALLGRLSPPAFLSAECQEQGRRFLTPRSRSPGPSAPQSVH